jgi:hypothetical protein
VRGTVSIVNSQIYSNTATYVLAVMHLKFTIALMGIPLLTCPTRLSSFNWDRSFVLPGTKCTCQPRLQNPIAPMGCLADIPTSTLVLDDGCCLDLPVWGACHVHLKLQKFPSPPRETHVWLVVCRVAVFTSIPAQSQSSTPKCIPIKLPSCVLMLKIPNALMW